MRPRFSLRTLLVLFFVISVTSYVVLVRPSAIANNFARLVEAKDFAQAESLFRDKSNHSLTDITDDNRTYSVEVQRSPTAWSDIWKLQRRISVHLKPDTPLPGASIRAAANFDAIATPLGVDPGGPYFMIFSQ
ncbi:MAG TPA: hypothetical protein VHU84_17210 [Lacipirellulaceae bacterium]|jgi:hypothetical protein|nr:hypothetical protein [Lacipirellulaceae bacterium]